MPTYSEPSNKFILPRCYGFRNLFKDELGMSVRLIVRLIHNTYLRYSDVTLRGSIRQLPEAVAAESWSVHLNKIYYC